MQGTVPETQMRAGFGEMLPAADGGDIIAMFEILFSEGKARIAEERHYRLVPADEIPGDILALYVR